MGCSGGNSGQESIRNGVFALREICAPEDTVVIHDGIRPLVDESVLSDVIVKCKQYGNAVTSLPYNEQIFIKTDAYTTKQYIPRETLRRVSEVFPVLRVPFEDTEICVPTAYDKIMRQYYGDWMQLPPEDKRKNHPPAVLELPTEQ